MMKRKLIIDTNLLLLLIIGAVDNGRHISNSKRLNAFCEKDYQNVLAILKGYSGVCITPYVAAEVSNLIDLNGDVRRKIFEVAKNFFSICEEVNTEVKSDSVLDFFVEFGLTDGSLINLSSEYLILSNDLRMMSVISGLNPDSVVPFIEHKKIRN